jgi:hypothetical protein
MSHRAGAFADDRPRLLFILVSLALVAFGIAVLHGLRELPERATMAVYYFSMICRCPWHDLPKAVQFLEPGAPWSIHIVPGPFRYRVLVPWLLGLAPVAPDTSLSVTTYVCLAASYMLILLSMHRAGLSTAAAIGGLALAFAFEPNLDAYFNPFRLDGFGLLIAALMMYALTVDSFWLFAAAGVVGLCARETTLMLMPVWAVRSVRRAAGLTAAAALAWLAARELLYGPPDIVEPMTILTMRFSKPASFVKDILSTWGWAYAIVAVGLAVLPARAFRDLGPMAIGLLALSAVSYLLASDTIRLFLILMPAVAVAAAGLIDVLIERRHRLLLVLLFALVVLQFCVSRETNLSHHPRALAAMFRPMRVGFAWTIAVMFSLRRELTGRVGDKADVVQLWR